MFHLWPQGRIVRISVLVLAVLLAFDLAYNGAYSSLSVWSLHQGEAASGRGQLIQGILYAVLGLAALLAGVIAAGPHKRAVQFLIEVEDEMTKVDWPKPGDLWRRTLVVAVALAVVTGIVLLTDLALVTGLDFIQKR